MKIKRNYKLFKILCVICIITFDIMLHFNLNDDHYEQ